jgi:hypothetical protein
MLMLHGLEEHELMRTLGPFKGTGTGGVAALQPILAATLAKRATASAAAAAEVGSTADSSMARPLAESPQAAAADAKEAILAVVDILS